MSDRDWSGGPMEPPNADGARVYWWPDLPRDPGITLAEIASARNTLRACPDRDLHDPYEPVA